MELPKDATGPKVDEEVIDMLIIFINGRGESMTVVILNSYIKSIQRHGSFINVVST